MAFEFNFELKLAASDKPQAIVLGIDHEVGCE
jgi:hypothetical protein